MRHLAIALTLVLAAGSALAYDHDDCTRRNFRFGHDDAYVKQEVINPGSLRSLKISVSNAPVSVEGGASAYKIIVCKAAEIESDLDAIRVTLVGNEVKSTGPDNHRWNVAYRIEVPRGAELDLSAKNGPLSVEDVDGTVTARSTNGPLSLRNVDGNVEAETRNGPISIS